MALRSISKPNAVPLMQQSWRMPSLTIVPAVSALGEAATIAPNATDADAQASHRLLACTAVGLFMLALLMHYAKLRIDPWRASDLPYYAAGLFLLALRFGMTRTGWRHATAVARLAEYVAIFALMSLIGAIASYPVAALTSGYADITLQRIDEAMGLDWLGWYRAVATHRSLQVLGTIAYRSIYLTPALLLWHYAKAGERDRAYRFLSGFAVAAIMTLALFSLMPAVGPLSHLWHGPIPYMPESELWQSGLIPALRAHEVHVIDLGQLRGIVSAPSFHTAAAVLYMAAAWRIPALRWPILALNGAMLLSTPVEGTHYFIDMILGALVAIASLVLMRTFHKR
jgi:hypothetical protein